MNTKCRDKVSFTGRTGSPKEVLEVAFRHQLNGVDHPVCRVPTMTEGRPLAISPPPGPGLPHPPSSSEAGELVLSKNIYSLGHICDCCGLCGDEGMGATRETWPQPREVIALFPSPWSAAGGVPAPPLSREGPPSTG